METGKRKLDRIKDHFQSFVTTFKNKSAVTNFNLFTTNGGEKCPSEETKEADSKVRKITDPRDREAYYGRVQSFTVMTWFAKPKDLSPLECARYGWKNIDVDMLECVSCKAKLCGKLPEGNTGHEYYEKLKVKIITAHEKCCLWSSSPSPVSFMMVEFHDKKEVMSEFSLHLKRLLAVRSKLPQISYKHFSEKGFDEEKLDSLISEYQHGLSTEESADLTFPIIKASLLLAVCGWKVSDRLSTVLTCNYCNRHIGVWNYKKVDTCNNGLEQSVNGSPNKDIACENGVTHSASGSPNMNTSPNKVKDTGENGDTQSASRHLSKDKSDDDVQSKRLKTEEKDLFDPVEEHSYWCPWIVDTAKEETSTNSSIIKSANDSFDSNSHLHDVSDTAWIQMFKMVFPAMINSNSQAASLSYYFKHKSPVKGIRILRNMLNSWCSPGDLIKQHKT